jgi:hypothetical protein
MTRKSKNVNENSTTACPEESVKLVKKFRPKEQLIVEFKGETRTDPWGPLFLLAVKQTIENPNQTKKINLLRSLPARQLDIHQKIKQSELPVEQAGGHDISRHECA